VCGCFYIESRESIETNELHEITHNVKEMQEEKGEPLCTLKTKIVLVL